MSVYGEGLALAVAAIEEIQVLRQRAGEIDLRAAESDKSETAHEAMLRTIIELADDTRAMIARVAAHYEDGDDVADIAAMAAMALQERRDLLVHVQPCDHWSFIESCERALRSVVKSGQAVEAALAWHSGLPMTPAAGGDLETALRIRRRYGMLCREVARSSSEQFDAAPRLRSASANIAALLRSDDYGSMRMGDRRELWMLQFRILSWLSSEHPTASEGDRLWDEVTTVVSLLGNINRRSELVSHDVAALTVLFESVRAQADASLLQAQAAPLAGLDPELDALLDGDTTAGDERPRWASVVTSLLNEKGVSPPCIVPVGVPARAPERAKSVDS